MLPQTILCHLKLLNALQKVMITTFKKVNTSTNSNLKTISNMRRDPFDILYIAAHGDIDGIALEDRDKESSVFLSWSELALVICEAGGLSKQSTIYLGCCDGGFKRAALTLMAACPTIHQVAGLPCKLAIRREALAFHTFVDHVHRFSDASRISKAVSTATDHQFNVYNRHEMDAEIAAFARDCPDIWMTPENLLRYHPQNENVQLAAE
jgi:hypothetical protein